MDIPIVDTKYEEARRCPRCNEPGIDESSAPGPNGSRMHTIRCMNPRCRWANTTYIVQVNRDGTIPDPTLHRVKNFPKLPPRSDEQQERINQAMLNQQLAGGGETR